MIGYYHTQVISTGRHHSVSVV